MKKQRPPRWAIKLLRQFCRPELADEIEGDLTEEFHKRAKKGKAFGPKLFFVIGVLTFIRPFALRRLHFPRFKMAQSYMVVAVRGIIRHKMFSAINVVGLAFSMSVGLAIISLIFELTKFDSFHEKKDRIWRVVSTVYDPVRPVDEKATAPLPVAEKLSSVSGVESIVRITRGFFDEVTLGEQGIPVEGYFTDPAFFQVFTFKLLHGNVETALDRPYSVILTRSTAEKLFQTIDVVGRTIHTKAFGEFMITGIVEDPPKQSHLQFDVISSFSTVATLERDGKLYPTLEYWDRTHRNYVYFLLSDSEATSAVKSVLANTSEEIYTDKSGWHATFDIQSLGSIVPGKDLSTQIGPKLNYLPIILLSSLATVIILSACFNYTNLSIARSLRRAREVGLRKISGARRVEIIWQFLLESVVLSLISLIAAIWLFATIRPYFLQNAPALQRLVDLQLTPTLIALFVLFAIVVGILAGVLPALLISNVSILSALKQLKTIRLVGPLGIRNGLVVFQFTLSLFLITGIGIMYRQYDYSVNKELGFNKEHLLNIDLQQTNPHKVVTAFSSLQDVESISFSSLLPGSSSTESSLIVINDDKDSMYVYSMSASPEFIQDIGLQFLAGSNFADSTGSDTERFAIVNEQFLSTLKVQHPIDAIGTTIHCEGNDLQIVGVVKDFHYTDLEEPIEPFLVRWKPSEYRFASMKLHSGEVPASLTRVEAAWKSVAPDVPLVARFYDDEIEETYSFYVRLMRVFGYIGVLAVSIAALGLLGMTTYTTETRMKEIGIRKVLGAKGLQIVALLSRGFLILIGAAAMIALPATYLLFDNLILDLSAYRITIGFLEMSAGLLIVLTIGGTAIAIEVLSAARANPVKMLREE